LSDHAREQLNEIESILSPVQDYIDVVDHVDHFTSISRYYTRARVCVLGSLLEGKSRCINEAVSCDTPVVCFKQFNQYVRGRDAAFPKGAGLYSEFDPECLADTIKTVFNNSETFTPRHAYLSTNGRKRFLGRVLETIPYYRESLPGFKEGRESVWLWLDLAVQNNYQVSLNDFLYGRKSNVAAVSGPENIRRVLGFYRHSVDR
jgi:hypothetical protein